MRLFKRPLGCLKEPHPSPIPRGGGWGAFIIFKFMKNINWKKIVEFAIAVLTALLGVLGANAMR